MLRVASVAETSVTVDVAVSNVVEINVSDVLLVFSYFTVRKVAELH